MKLICRKCREWHAWCGTCKHPRLRSEFASSTKSSSGLQHHCLRCQYDRTGGHKIVGCSTCGIQYIHRRNVRQSGRAKPTCDACYGAVKRCTVCDVVKSIDEFSIARDKAIGRASLCRNCRSHKWKNRSAREKFTQRERAYSIDFETFEAMKAEQDDVCAICREPQSGGLYVDHDHLTGAVRALLCRGCNFAIGQMKDNPELLRTAADYVEHHRDSVIRPSSER